MLKIKVPATSANLGVGFDIFGVSLNIYNEFEVTLSKEYQLKGFLSEFCNTENLFIFAYEETFRRAGKTAPTICIKAYCNIPIRKGLGSSSSLIVAGILTANYLMKNFFSMEKMLDIAVDIEGHPDNVTAAFLGGLVSSYMVNGHVKTRRYDINEKLRFWTIIPPFEMPTKRSRNALPKKIGYAEIVHNLGRVVQLPEALKKGDLEWIGELVQDKLHQPFRLKRIEMAYRVKEVAEINELPFYLSGSGSSMIVISKSEIVVRELSNIGYEIKVLKVGEPASIIEV